MNREIAVVLTKMTGDYEDHFGDYEDDCRDKWLITKMTMVERRWLVIRKIAVVLTKMTDDYEDHCGGYEDDCHDKWLITKMTMVVTKMTGD